MSMPDWSDAPEGKCPFAWESGKEMEMLGGALWHRNKHGRKAHAHMVALARAAHRSVPITQRSKKSVFEAAMLDALPEYLKGHARDMDAMLGVPRTALRRRWRKAPVYVQYLNQQDRLNNFDYRKAVSQRALKRSAAEAGRTDTAALPGSWGAVEDPQYRRNGVRMSRPLVDDLDDPRLNPLLRGGALRPAAASQPPLPPPPQGPDPSQGGNSAGGGPGTTEPWGGGSGQAPDLDACRAAFAPSLARKQAQAEQYIRENTSEGVRRAFYVNAAPFPRTVMPQGSMEALEALDPPPTAEEQDEIDEYGVIGFNYGGRVDTVQPLDQTGSKRPRLLPTLIQRR